MDIKFIPLVLIFLLLLSACDKGMGIYFEVRAKNNLNEKVIVNFGQFLYGNNMQNSVLNGGETKTLTIKTGRSFNYWGKEKNILVVIMNIVDTISVSSTVGTTVNLIRKEQNLYPNDTLFNFTPIPDNQQKGTAVYTLLIDSNLYK